MIRIAFWLCVVVTVYTYVGYPALIWWWARLSPKPVKRGAFEGTFSVLIASHNEARNLKKKIPGLLAAEQVEQLQEIVIASDGSTDGTEQVLARVADSRVRFLNFPERRGKAAVLNEAFPTCQGDVVVMMDARQEVDGKVFQYLLENFSDEEVGVVSGELVLRSKSAGTAMSEGVGAYWTYEKIIRRNESLTGSVPGATGAVYALRRAVFDPIPTSTILDDVAIPMQAVMRGYRCLFEPRAMVFDEPSGSPAQEAVRKRRTLAGNAQLVGLFPEWLVPWRNPIWLRYVSHKMARLLMPFLLLGALATNLALVGEAGYGILAGFQGAFYALAALGWMTQKAGWGVTWLSLPMTFVYLNGVTLLALWDAVRGRFDFTWERAYLDKPSES